MMRSSRLMNRIITAPKATKRPGWFRYISGQRLSMLFVILLLLGFAIASYVGSARNHQLLKNATRDRSVLILSTGKLTDLSKQELVYIQQLLVVVDQQNEALKKAGQKIIVIPAPPAKPFVIPVTPTPSVGK